MFSPPTLARRGVVALARRRASVTDVVHHMTKCSFTRLLPRRVAGLGSALARANLPPSRPALNLIPTRRVAVVATLVPSRGPPLSRRPKRSPRSHRSAFVFTARHARSAPFSREKVARRAPPSLTRRSELQPLPLPQVQKRSTTFENNRKRPKTVRKRAKKFKTSENVGNAKNP